MRCRCQRTSSTATEMWPGAPRTGLTLPQQLVLLRSNRICAGTGAVRRGRLCWRCRVRPSPLGRDYDILISYADGGSPDVIIEAPDLEALADGRQLPHVYHDPLRLCLSLPGSGQWTPAKRIDRTIVPWTCLWLYFFEEWLASDEWKGEGEHPTRNIQNIFSGRTRKRTRRWATPRILDSSCRSYRQSTKDDKRRRHLLMLWQRGSHRVTGSPPRLTHTPRVDTPPFEEYGTRPYRLK